MDDISLLHHQQQLRGQPFYQQSQDLQQTQVPLPPRHPEPYKPDPRGDDDEGEDDCGLALFWKNQMQDIEEHRGAFKSLDMPLARIKKIMKADEDVRMISAEAPLLFAKACEMFILELTLRGWTEALRNRRRTLLRSDVAEAMARCDMFDFLVDIVPREQQQPPPPMGPPLMAPPPTVPSSVSDEVLQSMLTPEMKLYFYQQLAQQQMNHLEISSQTPAEWPRNLPTTPSAHHFTTPTTDQAHIPSRKQPTAAPSPTP